MRKRTPGPVLLPATAPLTFRGLDLCDGCGTRLEPGDRLSGLCPTCQGVNTAPAGRESGMMESESAKTGEKQTTHQGQFKPGISGNPHGRPEGSRNKATLLAQSLMDGEAETLARKVVELAKGGDLDALRFCLSRILPPRKDRMIALRLPKIETATDILKALDRILHAVGKGEVSPAEAQALGATVESCRKALELDEVERRLANLEKAVTTIGRKRR